MSDEIRIEEMSGQDAEVAAMLVDLTLAEQAHYDHPPRDPRGGGAPAAGGADVRGENHLLVARDAAGHAVGVCWVVLFDPGTGLEAEIAELYVRPEVRGGGVARSAGHGGDRVPAPPQRELRVGLDARRQRPRAGRVSRRRLRSHRAGGADLAATSRSLSERHTPWVANNVAMPLSPDEVAHVAMLARLGLDDEERRRIGAELDLILDHISALQRADISDVPETAQVGEPGQRLARGRAASPA